LKVGFVAFEEIYTVIEGEGEGISKRKRERREERWWGNVYSGLGSVTS